MELSSELEARLVTLAGMTGRDTRALLNEAVERFANEEELFLAAVDRGIASADRGDVIDDEEVRSWLEARERSQ